MSLDRAFILQFPLEHLPPPHFHIYIGDHDVKSRNLQIGQKMLQYHWLGGKGEATLILIKYLTWIIEKWEMAPVFVGNFHSYSRKFHIDLLIQNIS